LSNQVDHDLIENQPHLKPYYDNKRLFYKNIICIMISSALYTFGFNATMSMMAMHMANVKLSPSQISGIFAITGWLAIPTILYISSLTDKCQWKWGRRLPFIAMAVPVLVIALFIFPFSTAFVSCLLLYLSFSMAAQTRSSTYPFLNNDISKKKYWGRITSINELLIGSVGGWLSIVVLLPLMSSHGAKTAFGVSAAAIALATVFLLLFIKEPPIRTDDKPNFNPLSVMWGTLKFGFSNRKNIPLFLAYAFCMNMCIPGTFIALQAKVNLNMTEGQVGTHILQYGLLTMIVVSFFIGWSIDKLGTGKSLVISYFLAFVAAMFGINPAYTAEIISKLFNYQISPVKMLAAAYIIGLVSYNLIGTAASIFVMSFVKRENFARFCACSGSVNLFSQSCVTLFIGFFVTHLFKGNYGFAFLASIILGLIGIILFFVVDRRKAESKIEINNKVLVTDKEMVNG
jgi:MFS family permease